ncbi:PREDICTED: uncharacterized protein LOC104813240 [Tarenaya hassleriana]|uniref:uncharacterized protein LOC104813240 n=1 Tax=Tarenaya hassleriana TaxID=28532 RepID=UPI00053C952E|nr:PREDICTED: uncharacterized protein LOC104813240 [Tarenaya hassleriana]
MSPSFPCPPSGYARNWANGQNLVESTKIERCKLDPKRVLRKGEKRRDKKERQEKSCKSLKHEQQYLHCKKIHDESEQLEKSGLTEEHEQPQNLCYLSDGSQSNNKRKREDPPPVVESHAKGVSSGKPLRIRFVFRKHKESETVPQEEHVPQCPAQCEKAAQDRKSSEQEENLPSTSQGKADAGIAIDTRKKKHKKSKESRYNALFDDLSLPALASTGLDDVDDDEDWLFGSRRPEKRRGEAAVETGKDESMNLASWGDFSWRRPTRSLFDVPSNSLWFF